MDLIRRAREVVLPVVVLGELFAGFRQGEKTERNAADLDEFRRSPRVRVAPVDEETSRLYAEIVGTLRAAGTPIPTNDIWIAAGAMQAGLRILTSDIHFTRVPQVSVELLETG